MAVARMVGASRKSMNAFFSRNRTAPSLLAMSWTDRRLFEMVGVTSAVILSVVASMGILICPT